MTTFYNTVDYARFVLKYIACNYFYYKIHAVHSFVVVVKVYINIISRINHGLEITLSAFKLINGILFNFTNIYFK